MRLGGLRSGVMFVAAFAATFAAMGVSAPKAKSQVGYQQRMTIMHANPQLHFSIVDPSQGIAGKFLFSTSQSSRLVEGHPYPSWIDPEYLYGFTMDGYTMRRVGQEGAQIDTTNFGNYFVRVTGGFLVTKNVPTNPQWIPSSYDLQEHFVLVGELNQGNPSLVGNSTGIMLVNPQTMAGYNVRAAPMFYGQSGSILYEDVCFGVYPGPDGDYTTIGDNEYRYVMAYSVEGTDAGGMYCLSLNRHETMNGTDPPSPWNPVPQTRGPSYTNVFPRVDANSSAGGIPYNLGGRAPVNNGQQYCRSYYARPGLAGQGFANTTDVTYVVAGWVSVVQLNPLRWGCFINGYTIGGATRISDLGVMMGIHDIAYPVDDIFKGMTIVGDWLLCSIGDGQNGDGFADQIAVTWLPDFFSGFGGFRGWINNGGGTMGWCGYHPDFTGHPFITYAGTGMGQSVIRATTSNPFQDHFVVGGLLEQTTPIDMHTDEEKLLGLNVRQAPQPFVGYYFSQDPANTFPGSKGGGGNGNGCSGSATGGAGASAGLLALFGMTFLLVQVLRETRRT